MDPISNILIFIGSICVLKYRILKRYPNLYIYIILGSLTGLKVLEEPRNLGVALDLIGAYLKNYEIDKADLVT